MLDASVLAALYVEDPATEASEAALERLEVDAQLHAPDLVLLEVAQVLWKRVRRDELSADDAMRGIGDLEAAAIRFFPSGSLVAQSLALALAHGFTAYDATYIALATRVGGTVVTNDAELHRRAREAGLPVAGPEDIG